MLRFVLFRLLHAIPLLIAVIFVILLMLQLIPGDPVQAMVGDFPVSPEFRTAITKQYHLDASFAVRVYSYFVNLLHGDFGYSYQFQKPVLDLIVETAPRTIALTLVGFLIAIPVGVLIGVISGTTRSKRVDHFLTSFSLVAYAIPTFWLGQLLVLVLAVHLGWFPTQGMGPLVSRAHGFSWLRERAHYIALPALAFAVHEGTRFARIMRASVADTLGQGYIITARAKGLTRWAIIRGHVLRNSSLPLISVAGYVLGSALGGAVLLETVFTWPGLGLLLVQAVRMRDNMTVVGIAIFAALAVIVINLLVDLLYAAIDPRIREQLMSGAAAIEPAANEPRRLVRAWRSLRTTTGNIARTRHGAIGGVILLLLAVVAAFAPWIAPYQPLQQAQASLTPPSWQNLFGTDNTGRDIFSLVIYGTRTSLAIGLGAALGALVVGGSVGMLAGYFRGVVESVLMRVVELFQTLPVIVLVLFTVALFGSSFWLLLVAVILAIWPAEARLVYGQYLRLRGMDFVAAAKVADLPTAHIMLREILPNAIQPVIVQLALDASVAILIEAGLGFLGLSDPNMVSWGQILHVAQDYMTVAWWTSLFPGAAICLAVVGFNLLADGLNEVVDPRMRGRLAGLQA